MAPVWEIMGRLVNRPLFAHPASALTVFNSFTQRMGWSPEPIPASNELTAIVEHIQGMAHRPMIGGMRTSLRGDLTVEQSRFVGDRVAAEDGGWRDVEPYLRTRAGTAIISITGSLVNRGAYVGAQSGVTSYEGISHQIDRIANDRKAGAVLIDISSPGGEAMGNAEVAAKLRALDQIKPVYAMVNSLAASAGYMIATGAREIIGTPSSLSGSIGCIMLHLDMTEAAEKQGVKPTLIIAGDHKADGHPMASLTPDALAEMKAGVNSYYDLFLTDVAKGRGTRLNKKAARDTQARTYIGKEAVTAGLIDDIGSFEQVLLAVDKVAGKRLATTPPKAVKGTTQMSLLTVQSDTQQGQAPQNPNPAPTAPPAPPAAAQGMDPVTAAIIAHADVAANGALLMPALALRAQSPNMDANAVVAFVKQFAQPAPAAAAPPPAPAPAAPPAPPATPPAAHGNNLPTNDLATRAADTGVDKVQGGGGQPAQGAGPGAPVVTAESHPWGKHIERTNERAKSFRSFETGRG